MNTKQFKKGDLVTRIASWDSTGTVYATHYIVSSWGKKQATLVKVNDGTNAEFRVYTADADRVHGVRSSKFIATADYTETLAMAFAVECIADENKLADSRLAWVIENFGENGTRGHDRSLIEFEQNIYARHKATTWAAAVITKE